LQIVLEGEGEQGAFTRADKVKQGGKISNRKWAPKNPDQFSQLRQAFGETLAREALFRCNDNMSHAQNYCEAMSHPERRYKRTPIPLTELETALRASLAPPRVPEATSSNGAQQESADSTPGTSTPAAAESSSMAVDEPGANGDGNRADATPGTRRTIDLFESLSRPSPDLHLTPLTPLEDVLRKKHDGSSSPKIVTPPTKDDLDEKRLALREGVITNSLEILSSVNDDSIAFELRDLVNAACKSNTFNGRDGIASTVLASLMSLHVSEEDLESLDQPTRFRRFEQIALYAHFLALILKNDQLFVTEVRTELRDELPTLLSFMAPQEGIASYAKCVSMILLIVEIILSKEN
jgi:E3 ubiquitin-protein ligase HUWE1